MTLGHRGNTDRDTPGICSIPAPGSTGRIIYYVAVGFFPVSSGFWDPRKAKRAEEDHDAWLAAEMSKLEGDAPSETVTAPAG
jgi:hypothetical protein